MAHYQQLKFIELSSEFFKWSNANNFSVLEIGSYNVNGTIRDYLPQNHYIGVDLDSGPDVDLVSDGHKLTFPDESFDLTISCESFEHNPYWKETLKNMYRMTKDQGFVVFTSASKGRMEHGTTRTDPLCSPGSQAISWDYYRNLTQDDINPVIKDLDFSFMTMLYNAISKDLYFVGQKNLSNTTVMNENLVQKFNAHVLPAFEYDPSLSRLERMSHILENIPMTYLAKRLNDETYREFMYKASSISAPVRKVLRAPKAIERRVKKYAKKALGLDRLER